MNFNLQEPNISQRETIELFLQFLTLVSLLFDKKINFQKLFIMIIQNKEIFELAKTFLDMESKVEICSFILYLEPSLAKSKILSALRNYD